jgi:hypothetical protein
VKRRAENGRAAREKNRCETAELALADPARLTARAEERLQLLRALCFGRHLRHEPKRTAILEPQIDARFFGEAPREVGIGPLAECLEPPQCRSTIAGRAEHAERCPRGGRRQGAVHRPFTLDHGGRDAAPR